MQLRIKRAFYKELAPNNPHLKIRSFKKRKNFVDNYEYEAVKVNWKGFGWSYNLYFYFDLNGQNIGTKLELTTPSGPGYIKNLMPDEFFENSDIPPEIRSWAMFNIDVIK